MKKKLLRAKVEEAKRMLTVAEEDLDHAMRELKSGARSNKMIVSEVIHDAFVKLRAAKAEVDTLVTLLGHDDGDEA